MKTLLIDQRLIYTGKELRPLFNYLEYGLLGDSTIAFRGACQVDPADMVDGEDLRSKDRITGSEMLHFLMEIYDADMPAAVAMQRLFASLVMEELQKKGAQLCREGDDLYDVGADGQKGSRKLSISIATRSTNAVHIHFSMNISNAGTPVPTLSLEDLGIEPEDFAREVLSRWQEEFTSLREACWKIRCV